MPLYNMHAVTNHWGLEKHHPKLGMENIPGFTTKNTDAARKNKFRAHKSLSGKNENDVQLYLEVQPGANEAEKMNIHIL